MCRIDLWHQKPYKYFWLCCALFFISLITTSTPADQAPVATVKSLIGTVLVTLQNQAAQPATAGMILQSGDSIQTQEKAVVVLRFSDDTTIQLGENTQLDLAVLLQDVETGARTSRVKLLWGKMRSFLSPGHQKADSSFEIETPNALAGVKFSHPYIETGYNPETKRSTIAAHTVSVVVTNTETGDIKEIAAGYEVTIEKTGMMIEQLSEELTTIFEDLPPLLEEDLPEFFEELPLKFQDDLLIVGEDLETVEEGLTNLGDALGGLGTTLKGMKGDSETDGEEAEEEEEE